MGNGAEHHVPLYCRCYLLGLVLQDAKCILHFGSSAYSSPCVATHGRPFMASALDRWCGYWPVVVGQGEAVVQQIGDVCASEGTQKRMGCPLQMEAGAAHRKIWESSSMFIHLFPVLGVVWPYSLCVTDTLRGGHAQLPHNCCTLV